MANITLFQDCPESQAVAQKLTFDMLNAMLIGMKECDQERHDRNIIPRDPSLDLSAPVNENDIIGDITRAQWAIDAIAPYNIPKYKALKIDKAIQWHANSIDYYSDMLVNKKPTPEHRAIMTPDFDHLEGVEAISEHLGENARPVAFTVNGKHHMIGATGLTNLEKIIYYEAGMTAQGDAVLPHEFRGRVHWSKDAGQIRAKFVKVGCTADQAQDLKRAFEIIGLPPADLDRKRTPHGSAPADWIRTMQLSPERFKAGLYWLLNLASELNAVAPPEDEIIDLADEYIDGEKEDFERETSSNDITGWHLLDDPRDLIEPKPLKKSTRCIELEKLCDAINGAKTYAELKAIGKSTFRNKGNIPEEKMFLFWSCYNRRKREFVALPTVAKKAIERIKDGASLAKAAAWLHGPAKTFLNELQLSAVWNAWKEAKAQQAKAN